MPNSIRIDGGQAILVSEPDYRDEERQEERIGSLTPYLGCPVTLAPGTTFAHIWKYIACDYEFMNIVFHDAMGGFDLKPFVDEAALDWNEQEHKDGMKEIVLYWEAKIWNNNLEIYTVLSGNGDYVDEQGINHPDTGYALEFTPVNELMDYPFRLDPELEIIEHKKTKRKRPPEQITIWKGTREWTVYDMIYGILDEISFFGKPSSRAAELAEIDQRMASIKDGTAKMIPWEDIKNKMDDEDENGEEESEK